MALSLPPGTPRRVLLWAGLALVVSACGGSVDLGDAAGDDGSGGGGAGGIVAGPGGGGGQPGVGGGGAGGLMSDFEEPECPDAVEVPADRECDPFAPPSLAGCDAGDGCYPYVAYPDGDDPCARERFGTACEPEGLGLQGDPCIATRCASGHLCVLTGDGTQCVQICPVFGENTCSDGLFCVQIDVQPGVGGCY